VDFYLPSSSTLNDEQVLSALRAINGTFVPVRVSSSTTAPVIQSFLGVVGGAKHASEPLPFLILLVAMGATFLK